MKHPTPATRSGLPPEATLGRLRFFRASSLNVAPRAARRPVLRPIAAPIPVRWARIYLNRIDRRTPPVGLGKPGNASCPARRAVSSGTPWPQRRTRQRLRLPSGAMQRPCDTKKVNEKGMVTRAVLYCRPQILCSLPNLVLFPPRGYIAERRIMARQLLVRRPFQPLNVLVD
jgi:hypothetical protein